MGSKKSNKIKRLVTDKNFRLNSRLNFLNDSLERKQSRQQRLQNRISRMTNNPWSIMNPDTTRFRSELLDRKIANTQRKIDYTQNRLNNFSNQDSNLKVVIGWEMIVTDINTDRLIEEAWLISVADTEQLAEYKLAKEIGKINLPNNLELDGDRLFKKLISKSKLNFELSKAMNQAKHNKIKLIIL